jgi:hypothetical protein
MIAFFRKNQTNTGQAFVFKLGREMVDGKPTGELTVFLSAAKQDKSGSFTGAFKSGDPSKRITVKLGEIELGGLIAAVNHFERQDFFHNFKDVKTAITFVPSKKAKTIKEKDATSGSLVDKTIELRVFSLGIVRGTNRFSTFFNSGEAELVKTFLEVCLKKILEDKIQNQFDYFLKYENETPQYSQEE